MNGTPADAMQLKPCPFCGVALRKYSNGGDYYHPPAKIEGGDGCALNGFEFTPDNWAINRWNTRTTSLAAQDGLVEALEKLLTAGVPRIWKSYRGDYCVSMMQKEYFGDTIPEALRAALASIEQPHD